MNKTVLASGLVMAVLAAGVALAARSALSDDGASAGAGASAAGGADGTAGSGAEDNDCAPAGVAGVQLPCLSSGAAERDAQHQAVLATANEGITIVNVWAWWCQPCRVEMPLLEHVVSRHPEWTLVGVHADKNAEAGQDFLAEMNIDLPSFQDSHNTFAGTLGLPGVIPITLVVRDGQVVGRLIQAFEEEAAIESAIQQALAASA